MVEKQKRKLLSIKIVCDMSLNIHGLFERLIYY
jgi:hypothetical protein